MSNHINGNLYHYAGNNPVRYIDPDGREVWGWIKASFPEGITCGWNDNAPQTKAGYHDWMDTVSPVLFNIDYAKINMGDYTIRFWKGDYGSTERRIARTIPATCMTAFLIGMAGGEVGLYNNDGRGFGKDGGSLMSSAGLDDLGIVNISLHVKDQKGNLVAFVGGKRAWPNVYNMLGHYKKSEIYTKTSFSFSSKEQAMDFSELFNNKLSGTKYENQFKVHQNEEKVTIIWGKSADE